MQTRKVLVIDDEQIVLDSVEKVLAGEGYQVEGVLSSRAGLDRALQGQYDLVLTDVRMPEIGGMRVLRDLKRARPSLPVVIITGYATVQSAVQAMKLGAADYVEKPFTPEELLQAVAGALEVAVAPAPEDQHLVHRDEMLKVLERAATDGEFVSRLNYQGVEALEEYGLTGPEKLALLTGDLDWIEAHLGPLTHLQKRWFEHHLSAEIW
jgi:DNA-binding NtrC family response regulator